MLPLTQVEGRLQKLRRLASVESDLLTRAVGEQVVSTAALRSMFASPPTAKREAVKKLVLSLADPDGQQGPRALTARGNLAWQSGRS